ncbi:MAG: methyl-accepting chemotaxis protein [Chitinivibrionales bacterium]|nr:methyl-accepting chemotaxis protein [Chitinivibrionales bacterium]MBD3356850.1 methyl-accepting chemotaxis protein [Chitinivibrionales bacterium]
MFKNMKLGTKLLVSFLLVGTIPFAIVAVVALTNGSKALSELAFNQLKSAQAIKANQIQNYIRERMSDVSVLAGNSAVATSMTAFKDAFEEEGDRVNGENWREVERKHADWLVQYKEEYGYYDLFLISNDGDVVYTVAKESDLGQNLVSGGLADSPLGKVFREARGKIGFADFEPFAPSGGKPASFVAAPVRKDGGTIGVVALQMPLTRINRIMQERAGMGETGETYLVGPDNLMRSDSYLDPTNHSVAASFSNPAKGSVKTVASREALAGRTDAKIIVDYNGNYVLSAFSPVKIGDVTWACIAEIDRAEAFASIRSLRWIIGVVALLAVAGIIGVALLITRTITKPINGVIGNLGEGAGLVASASEQLSASSQQMSEGASEQASSLEEVSSSLEEMSSTTKQNADNARQANTMATQANTAAETGREAMSKMGQAIGRIKNSSDETAKIIKTIDEIAMQTNLLALNAAVEAARAGEAGRGFAVVAEEVRNLAQRSAEAAKNTADLIEGAQRNAESGVTSSGEVESALDQISDSIKKVAQLIAEVSAASDEQSQGIDQVNTAVAQMDKVTQGNAANAEESASASEELSGQAQNLNAMVNELIAIVGGTARDTLAQHRHGNQQGRRVGDGRAARLSPPAGGSAGLRRAASHPTASHAPVPAAVGELRPDQVVPLDDDKELREF